MSRKWTVNWIPKQGVEPEHTLLGGIAARLAEAAANNPAFEFEQNAKAVLNAAFARLDFVAAGVRRPVGSPCPCPDLRRRAGGESRRARGAAR
jgi:hypothetical protein